MQIIVKGILGAVLAWVLLGFVISLLGNHYFIPSRISDLAERGRPIYGKVTGRDAADHQRVDYAYSIDGIEYTGSGQGGAGNAQFEGLTPGTTVYVYYDPGDPATSILGSPKYELSSQKLLIRAAAIVIPFWPVMIFFLLYFAIARSRESQVTNTEFP
jgi:hypothetical protein